MIYPLVKECGFNVVDVDGFNPGYLPTLKTTDRVDTVACMDLLIFNTVA